MFQHLEIRQQVQVGILNRLLDTLTMIDQLVRLPAVVMKQHGQLLGQIGLMMILILVGKVVGMDLVVKMILELIKKFFIEHLMIYIVDIQPISQIVQIYLEKVWEF